MIRDAKPYILCQRIFRYRSYENANLVSSKQLTSFTDFRLPLDHPDHLTLPGYVDYLSGYVDHFGFRSRINFLCKVVKVSRLKASDMKGPGHLVEYIKGAKGADGEVYWEEGSYFVAMVNYETERQFKKRGALEQPM